MTLEIAQVGWAHHLQILLGQLVTICIPEQARINEVNQALVRGGLQFGAKAESPQELSMYPFKHEKADYSVYWDVRKGLIPIVGGARESGVGSILLDL